MTSLFEYYKNIGTTLLKYETEIWIYPYGKLDYLPDFQANLSFVPVEVIESYRDDLIDTGVKDLSLSIPVTFRFYLLRSVLYIGMIVSMIFGIYLAINGIKFSIACLMAIFMTIPFVTTSIFLPSDRIARRLKFAHILTNEIYRRKGGDVNFRAKDFLWKKLDKNILGEVTTRDIH